MAHGRTQDGRTSNRGFASMDAERQREIASMGGKAVPDSKLESITAWSAKTTVNGVAIIGCELGQLQALAKQADIHDLALTDDFADSGQCWQSEQHGLMFWAAKGKVVNMTIFPRFDDSGEEPQWPE